MNAYVKNVIHWAKEQPEIRSIILVGSQARRDQPADEWSDIDLQVFATDPAPFLTSNDWLSILGTVWLCIPYQQPGAEPERLVIVEGGQKVDFHFSPAGELEAIIQAQILPEVYHRGYKILLDKDGLAARFPPCPYAPPPYQNPSRDEFLRSMELFWFEALQHAKMLRRGERWAGMMGEYQLLQRLGQIIEWHARAASGGQRDTWHAGRFLMEWANQDIRDALEDLSRRFDADGGWRFLQTITCLFHRLAAETAVWLGYTYPVRLDERISGIISDMARMNGLDNMNGAHKGSGS